MFCLKDAQGSYYLRTGLRDNHKDDAVSHRRKSMSRLVSFNILDKQLQSIGPVSHFHFMHQRARHIQSLLAEEMAVNCRVKGERYLRQAPSFHQPNNGKPPMLCISVRSYCFLFVCLFVCLMVGYQTVSQAALIIYSTVFFSYNGKTRIGRKTKNHLFVSSEQKLF